MKQISFADAEYAAKKRVTRRERFPGEMERVVPWAVNKRYAEEAPTDRDQLDRDYAEAMGEVAHRFPDDPDAAALYAEALMDTTPWNYWQKDSSPKPVTCTILSTLESVLAEHPDHPLANHPYIHSVEKVHPRRGVEAAERSGGLVPGAGHLVHMPGHIYIRVGRYEEAVLANERAIVADDAYITQCHAQGLYPVAYMPHNHHFLAAAAGFIGQSDKALAAARHMQAHQDQELMRSPGYATLQVYFATPSAPQSLGQSLGPPRPEAQGLAALTARRLRSDIRGPEPAISRLDRPCAQPKPRPRCDRGA